MRGRVTAALAALTFLLVLTYPVGAQGIVTPQHSDPNWQAEYWNNTSLTGLPVLTRAEPSLNYDWGSGSPDPTVQADHFSARWMRYIEVTPGTYEFKVTSDDGIRVWVDDALIIDQWTIHPPQTYYAERYLGSGHHLLKVEYFEETGQAVAQVQWYPKGSPPAPANWQAEYYNNISLSGAPVLTRNEVAINYDWGGGSPEPGVVNTDNFSVRWSQSPDLPAGTYTFSLTVDDGARLWVNGHLLIDVWYDQPASTYTGQIYLPGGPVPIELQYYERGGLAVAKLSWTSGGTTPPSGGVVIVDDTDPGFVTGGAAAGWRYVTTDGYNGRMIWTYNNYSVQPYYNWARWYPSLQAGWYEVFVYVPYWYTTTSHARYWIRHSGGYTLRIVDQAATGGQWVSLGTYAFTGTSTDYVSLSDVTYEPYRTRLIGFDAVKFVRQ